MDAMIRSLNRISYQGSLSVEWEDSSMDHEFGATESAAGVKKNDFKAQMLHLEMINFFGNRRGEICLALTYRNN